MESQSIVDWLPTLRLWVMPEQRTHADPDDLVNQFYLDRWEQVCEDFDSSTPGDWRGWLFRCFQTWQIDWLRKQTTKRAGGASVVRPLLGDGVAVEELNGFSEFLEMIEDLDSTHRIVLTLHFYAGLNQSEIGSVVGKNQPAVNQWVEEALEELRRIA